MKKESVYLLLTFFGILFVILGSMWVYVVSTSGVDDNYCPMKCMNEEKQFEETFTRNGEKYCICSDINGGEISRHKVMQMVGELNY